MQGRNKYMPEWEEEEEKKKEGEGAKRINAVQTSSTKDGSLEYG
jgi:hypothetical protein